MKRDGRLQRLIAATVWLRDKRSFLLIRDTIVEELSH